MIIKSVEIEKFRAFNQVSFCLGKRITAISGRNATQKTTLLGLISQPFTISKEHPMYGCKTIDGYNFRSQFFEKFKLSPEHDVIGQHKWKLNLHKNVSKKEYYSVESIPRKQAGHPTTLRFWNSESRKKGQGYIQLPVYFLSLSRLFPIGESGKTESVSLELTQEEINYCIKNYRTILCIQHMTGTPSVELEKGTASKVFSGVSDDVHDILTNSAGEGNVMRIILAVLSFRRLKEQYSRDYKGGILLIDEIDATLYGFAQMKLIEYLWKASNDYNIQIVFTTHSPIILKSVNKLQRAERNKKGINLPLYAYDSSIVYLEPNYDEEGIRTIMPKNIETSDELNRILNDINLSLSSGNSKINIYCEDTRAISFLQYVLLKYLNINPDMYMSFVDINLGWTNYVQLVEKGVPEFKNNVIVLDGDVPDKPEYHNKAKVILDSGNFIFLPLVIEKGMFSLLKKHEAFTKFSNTLSRNPNFNYDICFNDWPLEIGDYSTLDFKKWYAQAEKALGEQTCMFEFWCSEHYSDIEKFVNNFVVIFNRLADKNAVDAIPVILQNNSESE